LGWGIFYALAALSTWFVVYTAARTGRFGNSAEKDNPNLFGVWMFVKVLMAAGFSVAALFHFVKATAPLLAH